MKSWLGFGELDLIFNVTAGLKLPNLSQKVFVCMLYQLFIMSQCYIHASLFKIHPPVHEILRIQESVMLTLTPTGSAPKTICPWEGDIMSLWRTKSTTISWHGSYIPPFLSGILQFFKVTVFDWVFFSSWARTVCHRWGKKRYIQEKPPGIWQIWKLGFTNVAQCDSNPQNNNGALTHSSDWPNNLTIVPLKTWQDIRQDDMLI